MLLFNIFHRNQLSKMLAKYTCCLSAALPLPLPSPPGKLKLTTLRVFIFLCLMKKQRENFATHLGAGKNNRKCCRSKGMERVGGGELCRLQQSTCHLQATTTTTTWHTLITWQKFSSHACVACCMCNAFFQH